MTNLPVVSLNEKNVTTVDFGDIEFTDGVPLQWTLADGQVWIMTPKVLDDRNVSLSIVEAGQNGDGKAELSLHITSIPGHNVSLGTNNLNISLTPNIKLN
jgi:hypothetical protein